MRDLNKLKSKIEITMNKRMLDTCQHRYVLWSLQKSIRRDICNPFEYYCIAIKISTNYYQDIWVIGQVWGQDGWILAKFFFCEFMGRDRVEVHKLTKKERGQYPAILNEQAWSIKDLLYGFWGNFSCGTQQVVLSGQDSSILPARVANHSAGFDSSCLLAELAI